MNSCMRGVSAALCILAILPLGIGQTTEDSNAFLDRCEAAGEKGAQSVARAACAVIKTKCPPPAGQPRSFLADTPDALVIEVVRKTCDLLFTSTCKNRAAELLFDDPVCASIITEGPGEGSPDECPDYKAAEKIFLEEIEACDAEDLREQIEKQEEKEGEKGEEKKPVDKKQEKTEKGAPSLDDCEASGKTNGKSGAKKSCGVVKKKCAVKKARSALPAAAAKAARDQPLSLDEKLLIAVNRASCRTVYQTSCTNQATTSAFDDPACGDLIAQGPIGTPPPDCPDADAAYKTFIDSLKICEKEPSDLGTSEVEGGEEPTPSPVDPEIEPTPSPVGPEIDPTPSPVDPEIEPTPPPVDPEIEPTPESEKEAFDDPCACTPDGVVGGVKVPIKGCQGLCYVVGGKECSDANESQNYEDVFWRLC